MSWTNVAHSTLQALPLNGIGAVEFYRAYSNPTLIPPRMSRWRETILVMAQGVALGAPISFSIEALSEMTGFDLNPTVRTVVHVAAPILFFCAAPKVAQYMISTIERAARLID